MGLKIGIINKMIKQNIIVTGGNKGIGFGLVKELSQAHNVIFTVRSEAKGSQALENLKRYKSFPKFAVMDVTSSTSVKEGFSKIKDIFNNLDVLINNAGILIPGLKYNISSIDTDEDEILKTFNTNTLGALRVVRESDSLFKKGSRIVNVSSGMGQLEDMGSGSTSYRLSKTALNGLTAILSKEYLERNISVNSICPGWVQTDMGGENADLTIDESVKKICNFIFSKNFPTGKFLRHGTIIPW